MSEEKKIEKKNKHTFLTIMGAIFLILIILSVINNLKTNVEDTTFMIQKGYIHQECWSSQGNLSVNLAIDSTKPVDIYFTPSEKDVGLFLNNSKFINYPSCHSPQIYKRSISCVIDGKGCLVISNINGLEDSQVNLKISAN